MRILIFFLLAFVSYSCNNKNNNTESYPDLEIITVQDSESLDEIDFGDIFKGTRLIALETNKESLIGRIDRIIINSNRIYILDKRTNSIFVFSDTGKFILKIHKIGKGPGEYLNLMDFTLDENKNRLIVHSHRPYKFINYDLEGQFISEDTPSTYYSSIGLSDDQFIMINTSEEYKHRVLTKNFETRDEEEYLLFSKNADMFRYFSLRYPIVLKSKNNYINFSYSDTIYQFTKGALKPKYLLDFGKKRMPEDLLNREKDVVSISKEVYKNNYGFNIANFRENDTFISFSYGSSRIVTYSKRTKTSKVFNVIENPKEYIHFQNYFAHDGNDNSMLAIYSADLFKRQMNEYKKMSETWKKVPDSVKAIDRNLDEFSNPILMICEFKE